MGLWFFMLIMVIMIPITMILAGNGFVKNPPEEINRIFGYRTRRSMSSQAAWDFAHNLCGQLWYKAGKLMLVPSVIILLFFIKSDYTTLGIAGCVIGSIQLIVMFAITVKVERALKEKFNKS